MMFSSTDGMPFVPVDTAPQKPSLDAVIEEMVDRAINDRLVLSVHRHYFMASDKIVTVAVMRGTIQAEAGQLRAELPHLIKQVLRESLPRGLRWLIR